VRKSRSSAPLTALVGPCTIARSVRGETGGTDARAIHRVRKKGVLGDSGGHRLCSAWTGRSPAAGPW
jgi:hypothetical protein